MTVYSSISKQLGYTGSATIPSRDEAHDLVHRAKNSEEAFKKLMQIVRFAKTPMDTHKIETLNIIYDGFVKLRKDYEK